MPDDERDAGGARRVDHAEAFRDRQRHGLFAEDMPASRRRGAHVLDVILMWRRDVDDLDARIGAHILNAFVGPAGEILLEPRARFRPRIGAGDDLDALVHDERRHHERKGAAEASDAHAEFSLSHGRRLVSDVDDDFATAPAGDADHDIRGVLAGRQHEIAVIHIP